MIEQQELKEDASKVHSVSCSFNASRRCIEVGRTRTAKARKIDSKARRPDRSRNVIKIDSKYPPLAYSEVEKDIFCGRFKTAVVFQLRNAEKILEKKELVTIVMVYILH